MDYTCECDVMVEPLCFWIRFTFVISAMLMQSTCS